MAKKIERARKIFFAGFQLHRAVALLDKTQPVLGVPLAVCSAFAIEHYLKCLHVLERGDFTRTHNLLKLYTELSAETKTLMDQGWDRHFKPDEAKFHCELSGVPIISTAEEALSISAFAFEDWRYIYDAKPGPYMLSALLASLYEHLNPIFAGLPTAKKSGKGKVQAMR